MPIATLRSLLLTLCWGAAAFAPRARADSFPGSVTPRGLALGDALQAASVGEAATLFNPAGLALAKSYIIEGNFGFLPRAKTAGVSICDSATARVAACLYYDYLSWDPDEAALGQGALHRVGLATAMPLAPQLSLGINQKYSSFTLEDSAGVDIAERSADGYSLDAGLIIRMSQTVNLGVVGYNLITANEAVFERAFGGGLAINASPALMIAGDVRYNFERDAARYSGGAEFFVSPAGAQQGFPIRVGYLFDGLDKSSAVSGGLGYVTPSIALDVSVRRQVSHGDATTVELGLRFFLPDQGGGASR